MANLPITKSVAWAEKWSTRQKLYTMESPIMPDYIPAEEQPKQQTTSRGRALSINIAISVAVFLVLCLIAEGSIRVFNAATGKAVCDFGKTENGWLIGFNQIADDPRLGIELKPGSVGGNDANVGANEVRINAQGLRVSSDR